MQLTPPAWIDPAMPFTAVLDLYARDAAQEVAGTVDLPDGVVVDSLPDGCSADGRRITCRTPLLQPNVGQGFVLHLRAPKRLGGETLSFNAALADGGGAIVRQTALSRSFAVTTTAESGAGSLRAAIDAANASCLTLADRCAIVFDIETPARWWQTIHVASPLPPLVAPSLHVDGATQTGFTFLTNPYGPPIEISGDGAVDLDGLLTGGCNQTVSNLAINGFGRFGIFSAVNCTGGGATIANNFLGTDPTGSVAVPNYRGIGVGGVQVTSITGNVPSGNVRAGIYAMAGDLKIFSNRIGVAAHADTPLPNGASGIYVGPEAGRNRTRIDGNVIAFNGEMGIAIDRNADFAGGGSNRIWGNGGLAIDDGLDGPTPSVHTRVGPMAVPTITSAEYDPATGYTTIRGVAASGVGHYFATSVYASDAPGPGGYGDAQTEVGGVVQPNTAGPFTVKVYLDVRGKWVAAATVYDDYTYYDDAAARTTELGAAVQVR